MKLFFRELAELVQSAPEPIDLDALVEQAADKTVNCSKVLISKPDVQAGVKKAIIEDWNFLFAEEIDQQ